MSKYCIVAPIQVLESLYEHGAFGQNHLLLAHDIVKKDRAARYHALFHPNAGNPLDVVILDNSVAELMKPVELSMINEAAEIVKPTCVALPDKYLDSQGTIESCAAALDPWGDKLEDIPLMFIPQGKTEQEFFQCATHEPLMSDPRIRYWGIPRNIVALHGTRERAIRLCFALNPKRSIHLFGFSDNLYDDITCGTMPDVDSIDSAVPVRQEMRFPSMDFVGPRGKWWEEGEVTPTTIYNIHMARQVFGR